MSGETVQFEKAAVDAADKREQSTISFPYLDLESGIEVARAIYNRAGLGSCDLDELAAEMKQVISGAFRLKTGTARIFELTEKEGRGGIKLSELGRQVVQQDTERAARAEAFMRVPLYAAIFEKYKGHLLPPMKALEREMLSLGVSSKQTDKARQAFERSARQAGYFENGDDRLVRPRADLPTKKVETGSDGQNSGGVVTRDESGGGTGGKGGGGGGGSKELHPFIIGLLDELPPAKSDWSVQKRGDWLNAAATVFKLIYAGDGSIEIKTTGPGRDNGGSQ